MSSTLEKNHPVRVYLEENILIKELLGKLKTTDIERDFQAFFNIFNNLCEVEKHYVRKENQLFPYIEKYGWDTTSQYMWTFHDQIRDNLKEIRSTIELKKFDDLPLMIEELSANMEHMILLEESSIFPNALESLNESDWIEIQQGDVEVGTMLVKEYVHPGDDFKKREIELTNDAISLEEGHLTPLQVNLIFKNLPLDITYVDENDKVVFYNSTDHRVFPRSPGIIGREVKFCHPPSSVDMVIKIVEAFKSGAKSSAEFWINMNNKTIHIRFFAIRDGDIYKGVMEVTQDVTGIRALEGDRRILDWESN